MSGTAAVYIGDEVSACGYRLAGLKTYVPSQKNLPAELDGLIGKVALVLLSAEVAERLPDDYRQRLLARIEPSVVVVPDVRNNTQLADMGTYVRKQLGVLE